MPTIPSSSSHNPRRLDADALLPQLRLQLLTHLCSVPAATARTRLTACALCTGSASANTAIRSSSFKRPLLHEPADPLSAAATPAGSLRGGSNDLDQTILDTTDAARAVVKSHCPDLVLLTPSLDQKPVVAKHLPRPWTSPWFTADLRLQEG